MQIIGPRNVYTQKCGKSARFADYDQIMSVMAVLLNHLIDLQLRRILPLTYLRMKEVDSISREMDYKRSRNSKSWKDSTEHFRIETDL